MTRRHRALLTGIAIASNGCWFLAFAFANWLRFSSPTSPDVTTGQVIYEKASSGVFYITKSQAVWAQYDLLPIWLAGALSIGILALRRGRETTWDTSAVVAWRIIGWGWFVVMMALLVWGDQIISLALTGSLGVPHIPHAR